MCMIRLLVGLLWVVIPRGISRIGVLGILYRRLLILLVVLGPLSTQNTKFPAHSRVVVFCANGLKIADP